MENDAYRDTIIIMWRDNCNLSVLHKTKQETNKNEQQQEHFIRVCEQPTSNMMAIKLMHVMWIAIKTKKGDTQAHSENVRVSDKTQIRTLRTLNFHRLSSTQNVRDSLNDSCVRRTQNM